MPWKSRSRAMAIGLGLMMALATSASIAPAQAQQLNGFNALEPQWALGNPFMSSGFSAGSSFATGFNQQAYTAKLGSGTVGWLAESGGGGAGGISGDLFGPQFASPTSQRQDWFANLGNPAWSSISGSYKSAPDTTLNGLYTTASFGMTSIKAYPSGFSGLPNFAAGNDAVALTARAGVGLQLTPDISIEGSVGVTQVQTPAFR